MCWTLPRLLCQKKRLGPRSVVLKNHQWNAELKAPSPTEDPGSGSEFAAFVELVYAVGVAARQEMQHGKGNALDGGEHGEVDVLWEMALFWVRMVGMCSSELEKQHDDESGLVSCWTRLLEQLGMGGRFLGSCFVLSYGLVGHRGRHLEKR